MLEVLLLVQRGLLVDLLRWRELIALLALILLATVPRHIDVDLERLVPMLLS